MERKSDNKPTARETRLQVMLADDELQAVDDFRYQKRMPSRAAAVREILRRGLSATGFLTAPSTARSREFGVTRNDSQSAGSNGD